MSKKYQITEEVILKIIKMSYEAGCNGYMDLKDNVSCELFDESIKLCTPIVEYVNDSALTVQTNYLNSTISLSANQGGFMGDQFNFYSNV